MKTIYSELPLFTGFYNGYFNFLIENEETMVTEENIKEFEVDYVKTKESIVETYTDKMQEVFDNIGITDKLEYESVVSPKYYNYDTDRIIAKITIENSEKWLNENHKLIHADTFKEYIKDKYTPCSGYIPYHSNDLEYWEELFANKNIEELWLPIITFILEQNDIDTEYLYHEVVDTGILFLEYEFIEND